MRKIETEYVEHHEIESEDYIRVTADNENIYEVRRENLHQLLSLGYRQVK
ncbi:hypothetical protein [Jeotgalibacillus terrae]|uniref:Fur-regulated basic protein FbpA n=1 Tax=Jeotgalibacillus terrae TaxID=587735 RepID=A0ABW5ZPB4_9BACL|nr:hypothetical protein [Jeotgalibacillus terrae]MBM7580260.1 hypothetical protein [Jeotgalibacillus terrae]